MQKHRSGLTLIEVIVAILLFSVGALGMAAASAAITRQMTLSLLRSRAASIARTRDEEAHSRDCGAVAGGSETQQGIASRWSVSSGLVVSIDQEIERRGVAQQKTDHFLSAVPCS
jgi:prepilin-type N-terminal cleavage/methylation domain-containing protein